MASNRSIFSISTFGLSAARSITWIMEVALGVDSSFTVNCCTSLIFTLHQQPLSVVIELHAGICNFLPFCLIPFRAGNHCACMKIRVRYPNHVRLYKIEKRPGGFSGVLYVLARVKLL